MRVRESFAQYPCSGHYSITGRTPCSENGTPCDNMTISHQDIVNGDSAHSELRVLPNMRDPGWENN